MRISSATTFFWKFVFPGIWGIPLVVAIIQSIVKVDFSIKAISAFAFCSIALALILWMVGSLKSVHLTSDSLKISNYLRTISVPLENVAVVNDPDLSSHRRIFISFTSSTSFGNEIVLMPPILSAQATAIMLQDRVEAVLKAREAIS